MPPNILLITADHMRYDAIASAAGGCGPSALAHVIQTPNLDRLRREGVSFVNAFTPNPICVPARATITTGNYSHRCTGIKENKGRIHDDQPKLAELFANAGYATYAIGKLHYVPYAAPEQPRLLHGFQYAELHEEGRILAKFDPNGHRRGLEDYHDYLQDAGWGGHERSHGLGQNDVHPGTSPVPLELHEEAWVAERAIAALKRHAATQPGQPFLMWASFSKPHPPYDPPEPFASMYDPREIPLPLGGWDADELMVDRDPELLVRRVTFDWDSLSPEAVQLIRARYAGLVSFQDAMVGRLVRWLAEQNLLDRTIILYTCDHGDLLGDLGRFFKRSMLDGSVRVPMIWRVPGLGVLGDSHERAQMVGLQDILPTLATLTGIELAQAVDGVDLTPILRDSTAVGREVFVAQTDEPRCGGQKYMVRTQDWKYMYCEAGATEELYDTHDPEGELNNRAGEPLCRQVQADLRAYLVEWCREHGDTRMLADGDLVATPAPALSTAAFGVHWLGWRRY